MTVSKGNFFNYASEQTIIFFQNFDYKWIWLKTKVPPKYQINISKFGVSNPESCWPNRGRPWSRLLSIYSRLTRRSFMHLFEIVLLFFSDYLKWCILLTIRGTKLTPMSPKDSLILVCWRDWKMVKKSVMNQCTGMQSLPSIIKLHSLRAV